MEKVQEMLMPEGVIAVLAAMVAIAAREWRRVRLAREKRLEREHELLAEMVAGVASGEREIQVHHGGAAGAWSLTGTSSTGASHPEPSAGRGAVVGGRTVAARRRR
ncbi:hypothetical protein [Streptomyces stelliscabiei]|uniref:hypothetical protein n=1 Tax=Streptomyces stelliscabiei TaxID=146820 RepID=UPI0029B86218|nr:hypothetical protein [Streptomyces stelliscabiei]MDX2557268.1 hypothetical protein [Streptomyces stelliscabiei]MDX2616342.1 hypothetical protein [Streptomyces stelliscabiei]MDX2641043.1 hypothetical protein [Streptomyces stelliscabiei]MDX2665105.1 hypothetical protein [Streptomyces stelliscabiei]MDX2716220.1 hypothetical protein [Streptomyces stelliscabiei]